jgi:L-asparaginase
MNNFEPTPIHLDFEGEKRAAILIIYTGGTLGMSYNSDGALEPSSFDHILSELPVLKELKLRLSVISFEPPIDSSNIRIEQWGDIARIIESQYASFDGFVILHGTDTMAYSASALSFMLEGLNKPVVFTGAQLPIGLPRSDARENFIGALEIASDYKNGIPIVSEVCVFFDNILIRGNRAKKVESNHFDAFESENYPVLAEAGISIDYNQSALRKHASSAQLIVKTAMDDTVFILKLFPGINKEIISTMLNTDHIKGVVLESYGSGNVPNERWFLDMLAQASLNGKVILNISQCLGGRVIQGKYQTSSELESIGVVGGNDLTVEAATTKLMYALANHQNLEDVKACVSTDISGEMT